MHDLVASIVIPAYNEEKNIPKTVEEVQKTFRKYDIPYELILVNDNSTDSTPDVIKALMADDPNIKTVDRRPPGGFGRAIRAGLDAVTGDMVIIYMADLSDDPEDAIKYYKKIEEGYDCVFGSRFRKGSKVEKYPKFKLFVNRLVNRMIQIMFFCKYNDLTNAFKAYRTEVIRECGPFRASHFNITIEMSLSALTHKYNIAEIPINWYGRTWGSSNLRITQMGRRYLAVLLKAFSEKMLISDDIVAERLMHHTRAINEMAELRKRVDGLEGKMEELERERTPSTP